MTDRDDRELPAHATITGTWLDEMRRRQEDYAARRRRWTEAWHRGSGPEPPTDDDAPGSRRSRTIHDLPQFRFDF
jgi:hypothetical protein